VVEFTDEDDALLTELGVEVEIKSTTRHTPREERILAGFEDIQRFVEQHNRTPLHGEDRDIFERIYAVRLDRLRVLPETIALLTPLDRQGLLAGAAVISAAPAPEELDDDALLKELGVSGPPEGLSDLQYVRSAAEKRAAEEIADRTPCADFERFQPLIERATANLKTGLLQARAIVAGDRSISQGDMFVLDGLIAYVADVGAPLKTTAGEIDSRLRVIYSNGTESNLLLRSLQRAFYNDPAARRLVSPQSGQIAFGDTWEADDVESGTIYVLRSVSDHPYVAEHRALIHKIGVTGGKVETRIANAENEATYLLAKVEVVSTYKLAGINRSKLENLFHRLFAPARLNITISDRFGHPVQPEEWFLVPLFVIDEAVERIRDGTITQYTYDPKAGKLVKAGAM
jgi:T5orf172 domain